MHPEALILRRCYPVPVTFADLRAAAMSEPKAMHTLPWSWSDGKRWWHAAIKAQTGALDEVYAVVDGREVRVAVVDASSDGAAGVRDGDANGVRHEYVNHLLHTAAHEGYWERPHEVRIDLSPRPVSHGEVARAVLVGQEYVERHGNR